MIDTAAQSNPNPDVTFFVPCLNEEKNVAGALHTIMTAAANVGVSYEILVFDDGSSDDTAGAAERFAQERPEAQIRVVRNARHRGLGRNYAEGSYLGRGTYYMIVNGDNVERQDTIETLLAHLGEADMLIPHLGTFDKRPVGRRIASRTYTAIVNAVSGNHIHYYNGPVVHRRANVMRWHPDSHGFGYQAILITRLLDEGASYLEYVYRSEDRAFGVSKAFRVRNILSVGHSLLEIAFRRLRRVLFFRHA